MNFSEPDARGRLGQALQNTDTEPNGSAKRVGILARVAIADPERQNRGVLQSDKRAPVSALEINGNPRQNSDAFRAEPFGSVSVF